MLKLTPWLRNIFEMFCVESLVGKSKVKNNEILHSKAKVNTLWEQSADIWQINTGIFLLTAGCQDPEYSRDVHTGLKDETCKT